MRILKPFLVFLVFVVIATGIFSLVIPTHREIERSVTINAPAAKLFEQAVKMENFLEWAAWTQGDSSLEYSFNGKDGNPGARMTWSGNPVISGEGSMEITSVDFPNRISHLIWFRKPKSRTGRSVITFNESGGITTVTWKFNMDTPRPWNVFHLFSSLDKEMGPAFDESLADLKKLTEVSKGIPEAKKYDIQPVNFPATRYAAIRQQIKWDDMPVFFRVHFPILYEACGKEGITAGTATGLYFSWDEKERQTDMAAALPVPETASLDHIIVNMTDISASKAFALDYTGPYEKIREAYDAARDYFLANKLSQKFPVIEQYIKGPGNEPDTARWVTKIIFLVE